MLTRRPHPFLVGILIGAMLHLALAPMLRAQPGSATPIDGLPDDPAIILFPENPEATELIFNNLVIRNALLGTPIPIQGFVATGEELLVGTSNTLQPGVPTLPGDSIDISFDSGDGLLECDAFIVRDIAIDEFGESSDREQGWYDAIGAGARYITAILDFEDVRIAVDLIVLEVAIGFGGDDSWTNVVLPTMMIDDAELLDSALPGALDLYEATGDQQLVDLFLMDIRDRGFDVPDLYFYTDAPVGPRATPNPGAPELFVKGCGFCECGDFEEGTQECETLKNVRDQALVLMKDCRAGFDTLFESCLGQFIGAAILAILLGATCAFSFGMACLAALLALVPVTIALINCAIAWRDGLADCRNCFDARLELLCLQVCGGNLPIAPSGLPASCN